MPIAFALRGAANSDDDDDDDDERGVEAVDTARLLLPLPLPPLPAPNTARAATISSVTAVRKEAHAACSAALTVRKSNCLRCGRRESTSWRYDLASQIGLPLMMRVTQRVITELVENQEFSHTFFLE